MVSFQASPSPTVRKTIVPAEVENSSTNKRKWELDPQADHIHDDTFEKRSKAENTRSSSSSSSSPILDIELHLETPLPSEWQRCLDIQSGQIHFYNTRTKKRTCKDPRRSPEPLSPGPHHHHMSLELELNLPCDSLTKRNNSEVVANANEQLFSRQQLNSGSGDSNKKKSSTGGLTHGALSWLGVKEEEEAPPQQEMLARVCMKCHMLVMLCKSSPACPNCKFMHPLDQGPPKLFKQRLSLLC